MMRNVLLAVGTALGAAGEAKDCVTTNVRVCEVLKKVSVVVSILNDKEKNCTEALQSQLKEVSDALEALPPQDSQEVLKAFYDVSSVEVEPITSVEEPLTSTVTVEAEIKDGINKMGSSALQKIMDVVKEFSTKQMIANDVEEDVQGHVMGFLDNVTMIVSAETPEEIEAQIQAMKEEAAASAGISVQVMEAQIAALLPTVMEFLMLQVAQELQSAQCAQQAVPQIALV